MTPTPTATPSPTATPAGIVFPRDSGPQAEGVLGWSDSTVRINEFLPQPGLLRWDGLGAASPFDAFIELYNASDVAVALGGYRIQSSLSQRDYLLPLNTWIAPRGFLTLSNLETRVSLLGGDGTYWVRLVDFRGAPVQTVYYTMPEPGLSYRAVDDGENDWDLFDPAVADEEAAPAAGRAPGRPRGPREKRTSIPGEHHRPSKHPHARPHARLHKLPAFVDAAVADAKRLPEGSAVRLHGAISAPPGTFWPREWYVQDETAGILVQLRRKRAPALQEAHLAVVQGRIAHRQGESLLLVDDPAWAWSLGPGPPLLPAPLRPPEVSHENEARFATLRGTVQWRDQQNLWIEDGGEVFQAHLWSHKFDHLPPIVAGQTVVVQGIVGHYRVRAAPAWHAARRRAEPEEGFEDRHDLLPRTEADVYTLYGGDVLARFPATPAGEQPAPGAWAPAVGPSADLAPPLTR